MVEGTVVIEEANKVSASHTLGQGVNGRLRYSYVHGGVVAFEPCYDLGKNAWDLGVSGKVFGNNVARVSYHTVNRNLGLEWVKNSNVGGCFKVSAIFNLAEGLNWLLRVNGTWNCELSRGLSYRSSMKQYISYVADYRFIVLTFCCSSKTPCFCFDCFEWRCFRILSCGFPFFDPLFLYDSQCAT
ncbi:hypothetical protein Droror1_Dr00005652 [Drosera rotundifolia]